MSRVGSYIDSPSWINTKNATITPVSKDDDKCFQYNAILVLNHKGIGKNSRQIWKIKTFLSKFNWKGINYLSEKDDWIKIEKKNNPIIALNVLYVKEEEICQAYISKHN